MAYSSLTYHGYDIDTSNATTYTFTSKAIGTADTKRAVHVNVYVDYGGSTSAPTVTCAVGGVSLTQTYYGFQTDGGGGVAQFVGYITTGTSADIVVTSSLTLQRLGIAWYSFKPKSVTPRSGGTMWGSYGSGSSSGTYDLNTITDGLMIAADWCNQTGFGLSSSTGTLTQDASEQMEGASSFIRSASVLTGTSTSANVSFTYYNGNYRAGAVTVYGLEVGPPIEVTSTDGIGVGETTLLEPNIVIYEDEIIEELLITDELVSGYRQPQLVEETFRVRETTRLAPHIRMTSAIGLSDVNAYAFFAGKDITDSMGVSDQTATKLKLLTVVLERGGVSESIGVAYPVSVSDTVGISRAVKAVRAFLVLESLRLTETALGRASLRLGIVDAVRLRDSLARFFSGAVIDGFAVTESLAGLRHAVKAVTDGIGLSDTLTKKFVVRITASETVAIDDTEVLKRLLKPTLLDGVEIAAAYISPNESITTWAVNTKTGAVTEYSNYAFNSFAQLGNQYIGANSAGLYQLSGDDDAGTDIIAQIKSGFAQFGGSRFTSFKAAYLGMRGEGDFVLKLETGDGKTYNYAVVGKDMQTTKVHMGKGLRARYFAFELVSTGQDFDLDDIEFVPLVAQRRV